MDIGIAYDLKSDFAVSEAEPDDRLAEYDSPKTVEGIQGALRQLGHSPRPLGGGKKLLEQLMEDPPELLFNISEGWGTRSREAHVPAIAEMLRIPYTHSDPLTQAITLDKVMAKHIVRSHGLPTAPFFVVNTFEDIAKIDVPLPAIAKPAWEGSSMGIRQDSKARSLDVLKDKALKLLRDYQQPVLVESFLPGRELTVTLLGDKEPQVLGIMEIVPTKVPASEFIYSREFKIEFVEDVVYQCPPDLPPATLERVGQVARAIFMAFGCRDIARVDFRFDAQGEPAFIEINALPGICTGYSDAAIVADKAGMSYTELIDRIVRSASARFGLRMS